MTGSSQKSSGKTPSEIRKLILSEHTSLQDKLSQLESQMHKKDSNAVLTTFKEFNSMFVAHIQQEENYLMGALRETTGWGDVREAMLKKEHEEQKKQMSYITQKLQTGNVDNYKDDLKSFIELIRADIEKENKEFLSASVLKDDTITVESGS